MCWKWTSLSWHQHLSQAKIHNANGTGGEKQGFHKLQNHQTSSGCLEKESERGRVKIFSGNALKWQGKPFGSHFCSHSGLAITGSQHPPRIPLHVVVGFQPLLPSSFQIRLKPSVRYWAMGNDFKMFRASDTKTVNHGNSAHWWNCLVASPQKFSVFIENPPLVLAIMFRVSPSVKQQQKCHFYPDDWFLLFYSYPSKHPPPSFSYYEISRQSICSFTYTWPGSHLSPTLSNQWVASDLHILTWFDGKQL